MRATIGLAAAALVGLAMLAPARADTIDEDTQTVCHGTRCVGSYCQQDGDATNCWQESVLRRKPNEEVHWVCTRQHHRCKWVHGPMPEPDRFGQFQL